MFWLSEFYSRTPSIYSFPSSITLGAGGSFLFHSKLGALDTLTLLTLADVRNDWSILFSKSQPPGLHGKCVTRSAQWHCVLQKFSFSLDGAVRSHGGWTCYRHFATRRESPGTVKMKGSNCVLLFLHHLNEDDLVPTSKSVVKLNWLIYVR